MCEGERERDEGRKNCRCGYKVISTGCGGRQCGGVWKCDKGGNMKEREKNNGGREKRIRSGYS